MPDGWDYSLLDGSTPGFHLTINPQKPLHLKDRRAMNPKVTQIFQQHGLRLKGHELQSLTAGREKGIKTILTVLNKLGAYQILKPDDREKLAIKVADYLMTKSLQGQFSRTVPTLLDQQEQKTEALQMLFRQAHPPDSERGGIQSLIKKIPIGVSVKVHLPVDFL